MSYNFMERNLFSRFIRAPLKLGFFKKVTVHVIAMTLLTGLVITGATAYQFRKEMYRIEYDSAYMVYAAMVHFLSAHYAPQQRYDRRLLDLFFSQHFMQLDPEAAHQIEHRPLQIVIYDQMGRILYEYLDDAARDRATPLTPDRLPSVVELTHDRFSPVIEVIGPVDARNPAIGYVMILIPTEIRAQLGQLLTQAMLILFFVLAVSVLLSILFTRTMLAPIRALTGAARAVHRGDLQQHVPVSTEDEIGELAETFNEMIYSMDRRMDVMHRLQEWSMRIGRQLNSQRLFDALGEMFERMSTADSYRLYLLDPDTKQLVKRLEKGGKDLPGENDDTLSRMALAERWTIYLKADGAADNEPTDVQELAIPLLSGKHRVGVIRIGRKTDRSLYDDDTVTILQTLAQHASVAIDNASLYERLAAQERMQQEMTLARQIQQSMLPRKAPVVPGYEIVGGSAPALEVGGDYYDYVQRHQSTYLLVGDVSGKGVPAALIMSIVRALIHTYIEFEAGPKAILRKVNRNISADLDAEMFVTMSCIQLDPAAHRLTFARAGHEPILIVHADGRTEQRSPRGTALGMLEVDDFDDMLEDATYTMTSGDTVLLYTDGITEAQNEAHEEYGYERLEALVREQAQLSARELFETIIDDVHLFTAGVPQLDDITLMVIRRL